MSFFEQLDFQEHFAGEGYRAVIQFPNGYGASIITGAGFLTNKKYPYELAVLKNNELCYDTPIASDVLGYLTKEDVEDILIRISELEPIGAK